MVYRICVVCALALTWAAPISARRVGIITTVAGNGTFGYAGDGGPASLAVLDTPSGVAVDAAGNLYIADSYNHRVRRVDAATGTIATYAGDGYKDLYQNGRFFRDGWPAGQASLFFPTDLDFDPFGNLYILDRFNYRVRRVDAQTGDLTTVAGNGSPKWTYSPDWVYATDVDLHSPTRIALAGNGDLLITDEEDNRVRRVHLQSGIIFTLAGDTDDASRGDGGEAFRASVGSPGGIAVSPRGDIYLADGAAGTVRRIDGGTGIITTYAGGGNPPPGSIGDGGPAHEARISASGLAFDPEGNLHIVGGGRVRRVDAQTGIITTVAGGGQLEASSSEGAPATAVRLSRATDIAFDANGSFYIAELSGNRIRRVTFVDLPERSPDFDGDGRVGFSDFLLLAAAFGTDVPIFDLNWNGVVDLGDLEILTSAFGRRTAWDAQ